MKRGGSASEPAAASAAPAMAAGAARRRAAGAATPDVTTKPKYYDFTNILVRRLAVIHFVCFDSEDSSWSGWNALHGAPEPAGSKQTEVLLQMILTVPRRGVRKGGSGRNN